MDKERLNNNLGTNEHRKKIITLSSGRKVVFYKEHILPEDVEGGTFVISEHNGRDQTALTRESLKDIMRTLPLQQFYPVIGVRNNGLIEVLDGSRRRAAAILCGVGLDVMITDDKLNSNEARQLSKDIQTSVEHNIREIGMRLITMKSSGLTQKEIAKAENISQAKVTRAIQAAKVSAELLSLFPNHNELLFPDFKALLSVEQSLKAQGISVADFVSDNALELSKIRDSISLAGDEVKKSILEEIKSKTIDITEAMTKEKNTIIPLLRFSDKNRFARKKSSGRMFGYEFNRFPISLQERLDSVIIDVLTQYAEES